MKKLIILGVLFLFIFNINYGKKIKILKEVSIPERLAIGNGNIYILQKTTVFIYDEKTLKYKGKFGKEGEGPREIKKNTFGAPIGIMPYDNKVFITSASKVSIFTKDGKYIREQRVAQFDSFYPFADKYICLSQAEGKSKDSRVMAVFLADKNFKKGKILYKSDFQISMNFKWVFPITPFYPVAYEDKLFIIAGKEGFSIKRFDKNGNEIGKIYKKIKKIKLDSEYKKKTIKWFKEDPNYKKLWGFMKDRIAFKDYYPEIYTLFTGKNRLYALTNNVENDMRECIIMDFNGKEIIKTKLYSPVLYGLKYIFLSAVNDNYYYWIVENEEDEEWELYKVKIE